MPRSPAAPAATGRGRRLAPALGVLALSAAIAVLALATARGVVPLGGDSYATEFISGWWWAAFLLAPLPAVCARSWRTPAAVGVAALVVPHVVAAAVCVARYRAAGWGEGLEGLAFLHPVLLAFLASVLVAAAGRPAEAR